MTNTDTDIIIVGAGPAGLIAARKLEDLDISYTLISRDSAPGKDKACGGYVPHRAIDEFNLGDIPGAHPIDSIRMKFPDLEIRHVNLEKYAGVNVSRENLGNALLHSVNRSSGEIWLDTECNRIDITKDGCLIRYTKGSISSTLSCQAVIDASGANPSSLRFGHVRARPTNEQMGYAVQYQMKTEETLSNTNDFYYGTEFSPRGYAWNFPRDHETVVGTGGLVNKVRESSKRAFDYLNHLVANVKPISDELKDVGAVIVKEEAALMPLAGIVKPSYGQRILLAGDAAGHCSPITGEGIYYSMMGGFKAAETVSKCLRDKDFSETALSRYEKSWTSTFGADLKWGLWLQKRFLESGSRPMGSTFLSSEKSCRVIAEMLLGLRSVRSAILAIAPRYLVSKIRR
ncbi:MAG: geranylgeranyl reductase family protein [Candidatus Thorarchaeota archaeon]